MFPCTTCGHQTDHKPKATPYLHIRAAIRCWIWLENSEKGYYDRTWYGNLALNLTADAYEINALKDSVVWYSGKAEGKKSYTLNKTDLDNLIYTYSGTYTNEPWYDKYNGGTPTILELNAGNFFDFMEEEFQSASPDDFLPVSYDYFNENITPDMTGGNWDMNIENISYYVPEHILADKTSPANATKLYVKASMASAPDTISEEMGNQVTWNPTTWGDWVYALKPGGTENITKAEANAIWGFERDTVPHLIKKRRANNRVYTHYSALLESRNTLSKRKSYGKSGTCRIRIHHRQPRYSRILSAHMQWTG